MDEAFGMLSGKVQIIFLDIEMPGLNGIEAARLLQKKYPWNHNIRPKIRQQLQVLRDRGLISFLGNGQY